MARPQVKHWREKLFGPLFILTTPTNGDIVVRASSKIPEYETVFGAPKEPGIHISKRRNDGGDPIAKDGKGNPVVPGYNFSETAELSRLLEETVKVGDRKVTRRQLLLEGLQQGVEWWNQQSRDSTPKASRQRSQPSTQSVEDMIAKAVAAALAAQSAGQTAPESSAEPTSAVEVIESD